MSLIDDATAAERFAKAILDDITFDHDERVRRASDLKEELATELDEGRVLFRARVSPAFHRVYDDEILPWTGRAKTRASRLAPAKLDGTRLLFLIGGAAALIVVVVWLIVR
ncbi:hypothetical protein BH09MYX1_BH09MYX1_30730 [soil metagenome]